MSNGWRSRERANVAAQLEERERLRERGVFTVADILRADLERAGWTVQDLPGAAGPVSEEEWIGRQMRETVTAGSSRASRVFNLVLKEPD